MSASNLDPLAPLLPTARSVRKGYHALKPSIAPKEELSAVLNKAIEQIYAIVLWASQKGN
jgi:hypothetical protein